MSHSSIGHKQIDYLAKFLKNIKPWEMIPNDSLVKSGICFAMSNNKMLFAYLPVGGETNLDLSDIKDGSILIQLKVPR